MRTTLLSVNRRYLRFLVLFLALFFVSASEGAVLYVNTGAAGANDGSSWTNAFRSLQDALNASVDGDEIWVAAGVYRPTTGIDRSISFVMKNGVTLYGGFAGTETLQKQRKWRLNETVLSGNIGVPGSTTDNSYHVVVADGTNSSAVLDGFTITGGNANGATEEFKRGGGMHNDGGSPTVRNCRFVSNHADKYGGGIYNYNGSPAITNCIISENSSGEYGGGMHIWWNASTPVLTNCTFTSNTAYWGGGACTYLSGTSKFIECVFEYNSASGYGGGLFDSDGKPELTDSVFTGNSAAIEGGGVYNSGGSGTKTITGCTFSHNSAGEHGGGIYNKSVFDKLSVTNSTFFGNTAPTGGGMYNWSASSPIVTNCTFSANEATAGGGMFNTNWSNPELMNCTFAGNRADFGGDAVFNQVGSAPVATNSIFWGFVAPFGQIQNENTATFAVTYSVTDQPGTGNITDDPLLGALADNGGPTRTHALLAGSAAVNAGTSAGAPATDQRGVARPQGAGVDIGAYEQGGATPVPVPGPSGSGGGCTVGFSPWALLLLLPLSFLTRR